MNGGLQWKSALRIPCPLAEPGREALQTAVWEEESDTWAITTRGGGSPSWLTRCVGEYVGTSCLEVARIVHLCPPGGRVKM